MIECTMSDLLGAGASLKTGPFGTTLKASEYSESGVPVISVGEIGDGYLKLSERTPRVSEAVTARLPEYLLEANDIVFARKGSVDRSARIQEGEAGYFLGSDGLRLRVGAAAEPVFIAMQLRTSSTRDWLLQHAGGSTLHSLNQGTIGRIPLWLPPLPTQRAIAEVLGALDDKIAANDRISSQADLLAAALAERQLLLLRPIEELAEVVMGTSPKGETLNESGDGVEFFQGVRDFGLRVPLSRVFTTAPVKMADHGDVLISVRAPVGTINRADRDICIGRGLAAARTRTPNVLFHALRGASAWQSFNGEGTVFGSINQTDLRRTLVPWAEDEVVAVLEQALEPLEQRIDQAQAESLHLAELRDTLLPHLMSGRITVRDAEQQVEGVL